VIFLGVTLAAGLMILPFVARVSAVQISRTRAASTLLGRPIVPAAFVLGAFLAAVLPPLLVGPNTTGAFQFIGLLRHSGIGIAATELVILLVVPTVLVGIATRIQYRRGIFAAFIIATILALAAPVAARIVLRRNPTTHSTLENSFGAAAWVLRVAERTTGRKDWVD
jgi:hypothetical protein